MSSSSSENKTTKYLVAGGVALGIAGLGFYLWSSYKSEQESKKQKIKGKKPRPVSSPPAKASTTKAASNAETSKASKGAPKAATESPASTSSTTDPSKVEKEKIILVLEQLLQTAMIIVQNFSRTEAEFQSRAGDKLKSQQEIMALLHLHFEHNMQLQRTRMLKQLRMTEEDFNRALEKYQDDSRVFELFGELTQISQNVQKMSADEDPDLQVKIDSLGEEWTLERTQEVFVTLMEALLTCMEEAVENVNSRDPPLPKAQKPQEFQMIMMKRNEEVKQEVLATFNCNEETLDLAIRKYQNEPAFQETFMTQQRMQQWKVGQLLASFS